MPNRTRAMQWARPRIDNEIRQPSDNQFSTPDPGESLRPSPDLRASTGTDSARSQHREVAYEELIAISCISLAHGTCPAYTNNVPRQPARKSQRGPRWHSSSKQTTCTRRHLHFAREEALRPPGEIAQIDAATPTVKRALSDPSAATTSNGPNWALGSLGVRARPEAQENHRCRPSSRLSLATHFVPRRTVVASHQASYVESSSFYRLATTGYPTAQATPQ